MLNIHFFLLVNQMAVFLFLSPVIKTLPAVRGDLYASSAGEFRFLHGFLKNTTCFSKKALNSRPVSLLIWKSPFTISSFWFLQAAFMYQLQGRYLQNQVHLITLRPLVWSQMMTLLVMRSFRQKEQKSGALFLHSLAGHNVASGDNWSCGERFKRDHQLRLPRCT